ncbi:MAG TPA: hypothetical protein VFI91_08095 [Longimicrobiaceae bacterium]|nr:hypothetical protein [Longimicrobiaceae bacterium]
MTTEASYPRVTWQTVAREQASAVGVSLRREGALMLGALVLLTVLFTVALVRHQSDGNGPVSLNLDPSILFPVVILGFLVPLSVWKGEDPSRREYHWAMPIPRSSHAILKVIFGWSWYMAAVAGVLIWAGLIAIATGGDLGIGGTDGVPLWRWIVPFAAATIAYLLGSMVALGSEHPWAWYAGVVIGFFLLAGTAAAANLPWLLDILGAIRNGPFGLETAITGEIPIPREVTTSWGEVRTMLVGVPALTPWIGAALLWLGLAVSGVLAIAFRHRER